MKYNKINETARGKQFPFRLLFWGKNT